MAQVKIVAGILPLAEEADAGIRGQEVGAGGDFVACVATHPKEAGLVHALQNLEGCFNKEIGALAPIHRAAAEDDFFVGLDCQLGT